MKTPKEELSPTLQEAIRRARNDMAEGNHSDCFPAERMEVTQNIHFYCTEKQFNALINTLKVKEQALRKMEATARISFRSERSAKNTMRADKYRDQANVLEALLEAIQSDNYDKF
jgi:hypothetical protein